MTGSGSLQQRVYFVVEMTVAFSSVAEAQQRAPEALADHVRRSAALYAEGQVLMAGAFLQPDPDDGCLRTMAICPSQEAADAFVAGDPFVQNGQVLAHRIRPWANMFAR